MVLIVLMYESTLSFCSSVRALLRGAGCLYFLFNGLNSGGTLRYETSTCGWFALGATVALGPTSDLVFLRVRGVVVLRLLVGFIRKH